MPSANRKKIISFQSGDFEPKFKKYKCIKYSRIFLMYKLYLFNSAGVWFHEFWNLKNGSLFTKG